MKLKNILNSPIRYIKDRYFKKYPNEYDDISKDSGKVIDEDGEKFAIYKDSEGQIHRLSAYCTHLGCVVEWNDEKKRWDCPCHGSYFSKEGEAIKGPAKSDLKGKSKPDSENHVIEILEIKKLAHDVKSFKTTKPKSYNFTPGQATELAINMEEYKDRFHPFTFTSLDEDKYLEFTIKGYPTDKYPEHSGVTEKIHDLEAGDEFIIKNPIGTIEYQGKGVFLAGGAGITPFIAIFRYLKKNNELKGSTLIFSNRKKEDIFLENELKDYFNKERLVLTLSREQVEGYEYGRIDGELLKRHINNFDQYFYICGPNGFEEDITEDLVSLGADVNKIVVEEW
jgi:ferredoxin-NADP reductase